MQMGLYIELFLPLKVARSRHIEHDESLEGGLGVLLSMYDSIFSRIHVILEHLLTEEAET